MYVLDQIVKTKKTHVCGSNDLKLECLGCRRIIMMSKTELDKKIKLSNK